MTALTPRRPPNRTRPRLVTTPLTHSFPSKASSAMRLTGKRFSCLLGKRPNRSPSVRTPNRARSFSFSGPTPFKYRTDVFSCNAGARSTAPLRVSGYPCVLIGVMLRYSNVQNLLLYRKEAAHGQADHHPRYLEKSGRHRLEDHRHHDAPFSAEPSDREDHRRERDRKTRARRGQLPHVLQGPKSP